MPQQKDKLKPDLDDWLSDIDSESVEKSLAAGEILPSLKPKLDEVYKVEVLTTPRSFESDFGTTFSIDVDYNGLKHSLIIPKSFRFQLAVAMERKGIKSAAELIGKKLIFRKIIGDTKQYKKAKLYSVQIE